MTGAFQGTQVPTLLSGTLSPASPVILRSSTLQIPSNTTPPIIIGIGQVGQTITALPGTWTNTPSGFLFQWNRDGIPISGATSSTYTPTTGDVGHMISIMVIAANGRGAGFPITSTSPQFGVFKSTLMGGYASLFVSSETREINHFRVNPAGTMAVATQYNLIGSDGLSRESGDYHNTQINLYNLADKSLQIIAPPDPNQINASPSWSPDGNLIFWASSQTPSGRTGIAQYSVASKATTIYYDPGTFDIGGPEMDRQGDAMIFSSSQGIIFVLYQGSLIQFTTPGPSDIDTDPHWSPDGTKIAFARITSGVSHIVVATIGPFTTFQNIGEIALSVPGTAAAFDTPPTWSSDGQVLIASHLDPWDLGNRYLFTVNPDGTNRRSISLLAEYRMIEPYFGFSGGSVPSAEFYFSASSLTVFDLRPVNTGAPTISGTPKVGQTLTATTGTWNNNPISFTYTWADTISGISVLTSGNTFVPTAINVGHTLTVSVAAINSGGRDTVTSAPTAAVTSDVANPVMQLILDESISFPLAA